MNRFFPMNQNNDDDEEHQPTVFEIDEEIDVHFLEQAYPLNYFRRRYHMRRKLFLKIVKGISTYEADPLPDHFSFFRVRPDATGRMSLSVIMKCTTVIRQLAYGTTPDAFDEYLQMSERTARDCLFHSNKCIISLYMAEYLRKPTLEDVENIYNKHLTTHGFPEMLGSIDYNSVLFNDLLDDKAHVALYVVNGIGFEKGYYLADEGAWKDVERAFGVLQGRWGIIQQPARQYHVNTIRRIMYSYIIMHNMILKDQKMTVFDWNDVYANPSRNMQCTGVESMNNGSLINAEEVVLYEEGGKKRKVKCEVEVISWRERRVKSQVEVDADVDSVWTALTDYERLADFIPNLIF
ncbi:nucleotide-binding alpha-beta plait domain-containing protein, partial [Tanacetum coccineum]